jgi:hypothetical protein
MQHDFRVVALARERFAPLFEMTDGQLAARDARRMRVDAKPGYPCRVSLADAEVGETVILVPFTHHDVESPYRAQGPIFVRESATTAAFDMNEVPAMLRHRLLSVRAYDGAAMMKDAAVCEGTVLEQTIEGFFSHPDIAYLHVHNARPGCFNCEVRRA